MKQIKVSLPPELEAAANQARGQVPLSAWVRSLIHDAVSDERPHHGIPDVTIVTGAGTLQGRGIRATKLEHPQNPGFPVSAIPADVPKHRHRYVNDPEPFRHVKGEPVYVRRCACGDTKEGS